MASTVWRRWLPAVHRLATVATRLATLATRLQTRLEVKLVDVFFGEHKRLAEQDVSVDDLDLTQSTTPQ